MGNALLFPELEDNDKSYSFKKWGDTEPSQKCTFRKLANGIVMKNFC